MSSRRSRPARLTEAPRDRFWGGYIGYFQNPDGQLWEIVWQPNWEVPV